MTMRADNPTEPPTSFDWAIYSDATLAGLAVLIPIPFLDSMTEDYFRNRMVNAIAQRRQLAIHPQANAFVNRSRTDIWSRVGGCLLWPFRFVIDLILRLSRKILYFLTIKKAVDSLNRYWQRAYLIDYMVRAGYLNELEQLAPAAAALSQTLDAEGSSPLPKLARELIRSPGRLIQSVRRARQGEEDDRMVETKNTLSQAWSRYDDYFVRLQNHFEVAYEQSLPDEGFV